jgi:hypothetical protein
MSQEVISLNLKKRRFHVRMGRKKTPKKEHGTPGFSPVFRLNGESKTKSKAGKFFPGK